MLPRVKFAVWESILFDHRAFISSIDMNDVACFIGKVTCLPPRHYCNVKPFLYGML